MPQKRKGVFHSQGLEQKEFTGNIYLEDEGIASIVVAIPIVVAAAATTTTVVTSLGLVGLGLVFNCVRAVGRAR